MAKQSKQSRNDETEMPEGFETITPEHDPWWEPWRDDTAHPNPLIGTFLRERSLKNTFEGGNAKRAVMDIEYIADDGETSVFTVDLKAALAARVRTAKLQEGDRVCIRYLGRDSAGKYNYEMGVARGRG